MDIYQEKVYLIFIIVFALTLCLCVLFAFIQFINDFTRELKYLNREIARTKGLEQKHWIHRRRRLWLSIIPFVKY